MSTYKTGRIRLRSKRNKLILQIEVRGEWYDEDFINRSYNKWIDARVEDLTEDIFHGIKLIKKGKVD